MLFRGADLTLVWRPLVAMLIIGVGLFCHRHEPLPPRHFRELSAMVKTASGSGKTENELAEDLISRRLQGYQPIAVGRGN